MSTPTPAPARNGIALPVLGLLTLLMGVAYAVAGGAIIIAMDDWLSQGEGQIANAFSGGMIDNYLIVGWLLLVPALLGLVAGLGLLLRKQWGRFLGFSFAGVAMLLGVILLARGAQEFEDVALGTVQVLFAILVGIVLVLKGAVFSTARV